MNELTKAVRLCAERNGLFKPEEVEAAAFPEGDDPNNPLDVAEWLLGGDSGPVRCLKADALFHAGRSREWLETLVRCMCGQEQLGDRE